MAVEPPERQQPSVGQLVRVRQRQYLVEDVEQPDEDGHATLVRLSCVDDDAQGQALEVLWEHEVDARVLTGEDWSDLGKRGFDRPRLFSAYLHTLRWSCVTATDPRLFQAPFRAGIRIDAYQLEPLRKALLLPRVNLFIADDVGLGKTIEAGLIARELLLRKKTREIVVACPPSMLYQWQEEMEQRFGLTFEILDREYIAGVRLQRGYGVNPWTTHSRFLVSHRLLIDEAYAGPMRDWLGAFRPGALLILDEAHHAAPSSGARYGIDSKITRAVRDIAPRFEHRLFLSATPHNGHSNSFSALLELLDPQRFCRGVPVRGKRILEDVMVRRLKEDVREVVGGFPRREVVQVDVDGLPDDAPELILSRKLDQYRALREQRFSDETRRRQASAALLVCALQQRLLSSVEAFARTLRVHRRTVQRHWQEALEESHTGQQRLDLVGSSVGADDDLATLSEDELSAEEEAQIEAASRSCLGPTAEPTAEELFAQERALLEQMTEIAEASRALPDARVRRLVDWIRDNMCPDLPPLGQPAPTGALARWNDTRVIIFTEWDDTKRYLVERLSEAIAGTDRAMERIEVYHGPTPRAKRQDIKRAFTGDPKRYPVRILVATDAAREGLNLQFHCWNLFHFDVPWNPARLEQRNGRVDRKLQPHDVVYCHYFVYRQRPEDRVLQVLVRKTETIKRELGSLSQVVDGRLAEALKLGIRHGDVDRLEREIGKADLDAETRSTVEDELEQTRQRQDQLRGQVDHLRTRLEASKRWIRLDEAHFRDAISRSLELMGAEGLRGSPCGDNDGPPRFVFPALDQREGADPTWAATMDTLRAPRTQDQKIWQWRRESPIRPVVFEDPGTMDDEVVHLHLEHRVVQRLLGRFTAQGFVHDDLSRACLTQTQDAIPRVVLLGRLSLFGPGAARLHDEVVPVTARWVDPNQRNGVLLPYAREAEVKTLDLLENALLRSNGHRIGAPVLERLLATASTDVADLLPHLEERGFDLSVDAENKLAERGDREASAMRKILETQQKRVAQTAARYDDPQMLLPFDTDERRQLEANQRHWVKRLTELAQELETEPERIRDQYRIKAWRVEPVGLVYLWSVTG